MVGATRALQGERVPGGDTTSDTCTTHVWSTQARAASECVGARAPRLSMSFYVALRTWEQALTKREDRAPRCAVRRFAVSNTKLKPEHQFAKNNAIRTLGPLHLCARDAACAPPRHRAG